MNQHDESEFYIGYLPMAPQKTGGFIKRLSIVIAGFLVTVAAILVLHQGPFSSSAFDYGVPVTLQGQLFQYPVPHLKVIPSGDTASNNLAQSVLLVGFGKAGASVVIEKFKTKLNIIDDGVGVNISGNLIYGDGKCLMQVNESEDISLLASIERNENKQVEYFGELETLQGEIVDPKCYFGVMKPGEGKPHRSCAIRCISGGIPPVFHTDLGYYVLTDENGQPVNDDVLDIIGDQIVLMGHVVQMDNWNILKVKREVLSRLSVNRRSIQKLISINEQIATCK